MSCKFKFLIEKYGMANDLTSKKDLLIRDKILNCIKCLPKYENILDSEDYDQGFMASIIGKGLCDNPHRNETDGYSQWRLGWLDFRG